MLKSTARKDNQDSGLQKLRIFLYYEHKQEVNMIIVWSILCIAMIIFNIIVCRKVVKAANFKRWYMSALLAVLCWCILVKIENTVAYTATSVFA